MDMKEEMMNDALDDALGDEDDEEERYILAYLWPKIVMINENFDHPIIMESFLTQSVCTWGFFFHLHSSMAAACFDLNGSTCT